MITNYPYLNKNHNQLKHTLNITQYPITQIKKNLIIPIKTTSSHKKYTTKTLQPKITNIYHNYLNKPTSNKLPKSNLNISLNKKNINKPKKLLHQIKFKQSITPITKYHTKKFSTTKSQLNHFLHNNLKTYKNQQQSPTQPTITQLNIYLSIKIITPTYILKHIKTYLPSKNTKTLKKKLLIQQKLAHNFIHYTTQYNQLNTLPK